VRAWDLATGELRETYKHTPPRGVNAIVLSPDGSTFATFEELAGEADGGPAGAASLWDVKAKTYRPLSANLQSWAVYTPDGKTLAAPAKGKDGRVDMIKLIDMESARERLSIPIGEKEAELGYIALSPDGKLLVGQVRAKTGNLLRLWDPATGREVGSFEGEKKCVFMLMEFSPDGRFLAATNWRGEQGKLFLFDLSNRRLVRTVALGEKATVHRPAFSPDGKWVAVATQLIPEDFQPEKTAAEDVPQPRIHLVEVASGTERETLVAPPGFPASLCFSPDGKTLATSGNGRVLLWDLTKPPLGDGPGGK
jgi:WD40 repeat protein